MQTMSLEELGRELLDEARGTSARRAARTVVGGHERAMRQTLIALAGDAEMDEHESPGEGSVFVLSGKLVLRAGEESRDAGAGDLVELPPSRHSVAARDDVVFLLTAVPPARSTQN